MSKIDLSLIPNADNLNEESVTVNEEENASIITNKMYIDLYSKGIEATIDRYVLDTESRRVLIVFFSIVIVFWLVGVMCILTGNNSIYKISDNVLITLLTTTSINVIGMMLIILKDLFPRNNGKKNKKVGNKK